MSVDVERFAAKRLEHGGVVSQYLFHSLFVFIRGHRLPDFHQEFLFRVLFRFLDKEEIELETMIWTHFHFRLDAFAIVIPQFSLSQVFTCDNLVVPVGLIVIIVHEDEQEQRSFRLALFVPKCTIINLISMDTMNLLNEF